MFCRAIPPHESYYNALRAPASPASEPLRADGCLQLAVKSAKTDGDPRRSGEAPRL
jgi:hypothetical protein